jgi:hypothetical protein
MHYEWHNKYLNEENYLFLTILNYFRQILVAFKYFVQSDWRIIVKNVELPLNIERPRYINSKFCYVETETFLIYFVHLEVVFPEIQVYLKMLEWSSSVLQCEYSVTKHHVHLLWTVNHSIYFRKILNRCIMNGIINT